MCWRQVPGAGAGAAPVCGHWVEHVVLVRMHRASLASLLLHCCFTAASLLLHCCFNVEPWALIMQMCWWVDELMSWCKCVDELMSWWVDANVLMSWWVDELMQMCWCKCVDELMQMCWWVNANVCECVFLRQRVVCSWDKVCSWDNVCYCVLLRRRVLSLSQRGWDSMRRQQVERTCWDDNISFWHSYLDFSDFSDFSNTKNTYKEYVISIFNGEVEELGVYGVPR